MSATSLVMILLIISSVFYYVARWKSLTMGRRLGGIRYLSSTPSYYGVVAAFAFGLPSLILLGLWLYLEQNVLINIVLSEFFANVEFATESELDILVSQIQIMSTNPQLNLVADSEAVRAAADRYAELTAMNASLRNWSVVALGASIGTGFLFWFRPKFGARVVAEVVIRYIMLGCALIAVFTTFGIVFSVLFEAISFFQQVPFFDFLLGLNWSPQIAIREDQVGSSGSFGSIPLFTGTLLIAGIAMAVAVPVGIMSAIYLSEYASRNVRAVAKPALEVLAGVPTVVYGFFAVLIVAPAVRDLGLLVGLDVAHESALAAGLVMGIMIIPFISSLSDDVISAVPSSIREASMAIGATQSETMKKVIVPAALPGIIGAFLLAISRAIGETMIVLMAAGLAARLTANPLESVTTVTVQIVTLLVGDQEFDSPKTLAAFALGLTLFVVTLVLNFTALYVVRKYSEQYE